MSASGMRSSERLFTFGARVFWLGIVAALIGIVPPVFHGAPWLVWVGCLAALLGGTGMMIGYRPRK